MCIRDDKWHWLTVALSAALVIDVLWAFEDDRKVHHAADKGIQIIKDAREVLQILNDKKAGTKFIKSFYRADRENFTEYDEAKLLQDIVRKMDWKTWEKDLEQWLVNKDKVIDFFAKVQSESNWRCRSRGCF